MKTLIKAIVEHTILGGKCADCKGKDLDEFCVTCQFANGISGQEAVENNWDRSDILRIAKERKIN